LWRDASPTRSFTPPPLSKTRLAIVSLTSLLATSFAARVLLAHRVDSDSLWHIRTGQWIVENGRVPTTDIFSWIGAERGLAWAPHEWLFDIGIWGIYSGGGFAGLYWVTCLTFGVFAALVFALAYRRSGQWVLSLIVALLGTMGVAPFLAPRPQVATFALLTAVALLLELRKPYLAVLVMLLGVNVHGAMYPIYLGLFAFYCLPRRDWLPILCAVGATLLTPIGTRLLPYPLFAFDAQVALFQEYAPTVLKQSWVLLIAFIGIVLLLDRRRLPVWDGLLVLLLTLLSISAVRHTALFFGIALPILTPYLRFPQPEHEGKRTEERQLQLPEPDRILMVFLAFAVVLSVGRLWGSSIDVDKDYPAQALKWMQDEGLMRVWNPWGDGGYLIYRGVPTFVDGRADPFSPFFDPTVTIASDVASAHYLNSDPRDLVAKYGIRYTLLKRRTALYQVLVQSKDFEMVYSDDDYAVFKTSERLLRE
jgi:hypothetical protein